MAGDSRLHRESILAGEQIPKGVPASGLIQAVRLVYDRLEWHPIDRLRNEESKVALDTMHTWRSKPYGGDQALQTGRHFAIAEGEKPDPAGVDALLADFKRQLK